MFFNKNYGGWSKTFKESASVFVFVWCGLCLGSPRACGLPKNWENNKYVITFVTYLQTFPTKSLLILYANYTNS